MSGPSDIVYFIHAQRSLWREIDTVDPPLLPHELDPPMLMSQGTVNWVLQTFAYLRKAGRLVALRTQIVPGAINVIHVDHLAVSMRAHRGFVVAVQADRGRPVMCDMVVVQNHMNIADGSTDFFMPHWTQPGLVERKASRGDRFKRVACMGLPHNLHASLREPAFAERVRSEGFEFVIPAMQDWHDYSRLDAVVSIREDSEFKARHKPATKLFNAWRAGVLPLMGPDSSCQTAGRPGLDYVEVEDADAVMSALVHLREDRMMRHAIVLNGRDMSSQYSPEAITRAWWSLLTGPVREAYDAYRSRGMVGEADRAVRFPWQAWQHRRKQRAYWKKIK